MRKDQIKTGEVFAYRERGRSPESKPEPLVFLSTDLFTFNSALSHTANSTKPVITRAKTGASARSGYAISTGYLAVVPDGGVLGDSHKASLEDLTRLTVADALAATSRYDRPRGFRWVVLHRLHEVQPGYSALIEEYDAKLNQRRREREAADRLMNEATNRAMLLQGALEKLGVTTGTKHDLQFGMPNALILSFDNAEKLIKLLEDK